MNFFSRRVCVLLIIHWSPSCTEWLEIVERYSLKVFAMSSGVRPQVDNL